MTETALAVPALLCPNCQEDILTQGFYNSCSETTSLREENNAIVRDGRVYLDHEEDNYDTVSHECDVEAYCSSCMELLPWALYEIRELDYKTLAEAEKRIAELIAEVEPEDAAESKSEDAEEEANSDEPLATA